MRGLFKIVVIVFLLMWFWGLVRPASALVCCGTYTCTKFDGDGNALDDYTAQCGGAGCGGGCPAGYDESDGCSMETSCGGGGGTCECGTNANGSCKSCGGSCNADYIYNCAGVVTPALTGYVQANVNAACKDSSGNVVVGSGQTLAGCAETVIDDQGNEVCRVVSIANHQCCAAGSSYTCESVYATSTQTWGWQDGTVVCPAGWEEIDRVWGIAPCVTRRNDDGEQELRCGTRLTCRSLTTSQSCTCTTCNSTAPTGLSIEQGASANAN